MTNFFIPYDENFHLENHYWDGYTLILPCVSVGNVPQLSTDLLINQFLKHPGSSTSELKKDLKFVGYLSSKHVRPFAGPDPFKMNGSLLSSSIQVFESKSKKMVIIQQRSPIYKEYRENFYQELSEWLSCHKFELILLLSSSFDHFLAPEFFDRTTIPIMYLSNHLDGSLKLFLEDTLQIKPVIKVDPYSMKPSEQGKIHLPGSGSARSFLKYFSPNQNILCLIMYCSEGDNRFHSFRLADKVADILNHSNDIIINKCENNDHHADEPSLFNQNRYPWTEPFSWRMMFGDEPPAEIY